LCKNIENLPVVTSSDVARFLGARGQLLRWTQPKENAGFQKNHNLFIGFIFIWLNSLKKTIERRKSIFLI